MIHNFNILECQQGIKQEMITFRKSKIISKYKKIIKYLYSNNRFIFSRELEKIFELESSEIRQCIRHGRRSGHPIISGSNGYYIEKDTLKLIEFSYKLKSRAIDILETVHFINKTAIRKQHFSLFERIKV